MSVPAGGGAGPRAGTCSRDRAAKRSSSQVSDQQLATLGTALKLRRLQYRAPACLGAVLDGGGAVHLAAHVGARRHGDGRRGLVRPAH